MTVTDILTFVFVTSLLVMSPGLNGVLILRTVPTSGRSAGFACIAGFVAAFYMHGTFAVFGISVILIQSATTFTIVKILGAAYLCWIGVKALIAAFKGAKGSADVAPAQKRRTNRKAFFEGFLTNGLNPKVSMFYLAAFPQFITTGETSTASAYLLVALHSMIATLWFGALALLFAKLTSITRTGHFQRWLKGVTGIVFIGFGAKLATIRAGSL